VTTDDAMVGVSRAMLAPGAPTFLWYSRVGGSSNFDPAGRASGNVIEFDGENHELTRITLPRDTAEKVTDRVDAGDVVEALARPVTWNMSIAAIRRMRSEKSASAPTWRRSEIVEWLLSALASLMMASLAFWIGGEFAFGRNRRLLWAALGFVLGPLGMLLMLSLVEWPLRESCPSCHRMRVVTRVDCEHCNAPFQPPPVDGTEIFESATF
jgi:hypothetical protein